MNASTDRLESIFFEAIQIDDEGQRSEFISTACAGDVALRQCLDELIGNHRRAGTFLEPASDSALPAVESTESSHGTYRWLERIGEGGMGIVYRAEQLQPVHRFVALKILRSGLNSAQILARFEHERQALARMNHPHIASVYDAGVTADGRPFFAMELVEGTPLTEFCDQWQLSVRERIELMLPVCRAVQHAHQKGIIHRDLKPSNVLVSAEDGRPVPKVIDFGVAKVADSTVVAALHSTETGQIVGTMEYMAPEQADMKNQDIDTRADIYALGVLLYELISGSPPFTAETLRDRGFAEMLRTIQEVEPAKPSTKLTMANDAPQIAARRRSEVDRLARVVRGDLDWITLKCLEKSRARRYETANGLASDLERYLANQPVLARPPSLRYLLGKFIRRHRAAVVAGSLVATTLVASFIGIGIALRNAQTEQRRAEIAQAQALAAKQREAARANAEAQERRRAELAEAEAETVIDFLLNDLIGQAGSLAQAARNLPPTPDLTIREALDRAAAKVGETFHDDRILEAAIRTTIGDSYLQLGLDEPAAVQLEQAAAIRTAQFGRNHPQTLQAHDSLARAYRGLKQYAAAIELLEYNAACRIADLGLDHRITLVTRDNLAVAYRDAGRNDEALRLFEQVRDAKIRVLGPEDPATLTTLHNLASLYMDNGQTHEAIAALQQVHAAKVRVLGPDHPETLPSLQNLAVTYWKAKQLDESIPRFEQLCQLHRRVHGESHPLTLASRANLAVNYRDAGRWDEAIAVLEDVLARGASHPALKWVGPELSLAYQRAGRVEQAIALEQTMLAEQRVALREDASRRATALAGTGVRLLALRAWSNAEAVLRECVELRQQNEPDEWRTFNTLSLLGEALVGQAKYAEAEPWLLAGYRGLVERQARLPAGTPSRTTDALQRVVRLYEGWGKSAEAARWSELLSEADHSDGR